MSISLIALELVWTRIFSSEFFYTFAFLTLSLAVMGLGLGALTLRLFSSLDKDRNLGAFLSLTGLTALIGPPIVLRLGLKFSELFNSAAMVGKFVLVVLILSSSFYFGGIALAMVFKRNHQQMPRLYMADLLGAGGGVIAAIMMMNWFGTLAATFLIALPMLLAALIASRGILKVVPVVLLASMTLMCFQSRELLDVPRPEPAPVIYKHWDAMAKVKIYDQTTYRRLNIDNVANSPMIPFDGNWDRPDSMRFQFGIAFDWLVKQFDSCVFLSLGAGGGGDVLQALQEGATEIHAVEVIPHINKMMTEGDPSGYIPIPPPEPDTAAADSTTGETSDESDTAPADTEADGTTLATADTAETEPPEVITCVDYTGRIYHDPRVKVVTEDARAYVRSHKNKFDVIFSLSSNTWAALASGSFALAENYLFTKEAFKDYWESLSDSGFLAMEHQFYMPRLVSECLEALDELGVPNKEDHIAVYDLPHMHRNLLLLSRRPLTDTIRYHAFFDLQPEVYQYFHLRYPAPDSTQDDLINQIVLDGWESMADSVPYDLSPCTDDRPFVAQMGMWKNFEFGNLERILPYEFYGFPLTTLIILVILIVVVVLIIPLNLIPYLKSGPKLRAIPWLYFFTIGAAFMIVEIILMQKYALFIGPSVYSIAVILITLLISSGIGSRFAARVDYRVAFLGIVGWLLLDVLVFRHIPYVMGGLAMSLRMLITAAVIAPLGFFMGMPFPKGTLRVRELIDWGFAVNGAASVVGSTAVILVAVNYGFSVSLLLAALLYLLAFAMISKKSAWQ